jgi:tungstate transport system ATP-binding protein
MGAEARGMRAERSALPLRLEGLSFAARGATLIDGVTLTVRPHRRLFVLGPNGAGKSLLLRLAHGLIPPTGGRVVWTDPERALTAQAMVFQRPVLLRRPVRGNLVHALRLRGHDRRAARARANAALERFGLEALAGRPARLLSGGEQQRLAMARAWALKPEVLFLDEPTSQLDPGSTKAIEAMIADFSAGGMTIVMTTHDLGQARRLADDVAFLHRGRLTETEPARSFFEQPTSPEARAFVAGDLLW